MQRRTIVIMFYNCHAVFRRRYIKTVICVILGVIFVVTLSQYKLSYVGLSRLREYQYARTHLEEINKFVSDRKEWPTSGLGSWLFKYDEHVTPQDRNFSILVWEYWDWLSARHLNRYGSTGHDPLEDCSVKNCIFTGDNDKLATVDAVVVHLQHGAIPEVENRDPLQRWIFLNDESPKNVFSLAKRPITLKDLANVFNWSMTYRSDADIPVPYGRTIALHKPLFKSKYFDINSLTEIIPNWKKKRRDVLATILISNCKVKFRMDFLLELQKFIPIDIYGGCSKNTTNRRRCPGHFRSDCQPISEYLFYLALENSNCHEYLTEKIWYHAYRKGAIPIIMGPSLSDCQRLLPPNSYIYIPIEHNSREVENLVQQMIDLSKNDEYLLSLHKWRNNFKVLNEHGYFGTKSYHFCRVCEALNYNDGAEKIYSEDDLRSFLDPKLMCEN